MKPEVPHVDLLDNSSLFLAADALGKVVGREKTVVSYKALLDALARKRRTLRMPPATTTVGLTAVDPSSESQRRFVDALKHLAIRVDQCDFRDAFPSQPPGYMGASLIREGAKGMEPKDNVVASLGARMAFTLGTLTRFCTPTASPSVIVITHAFEVEAAIRSLRSRGADVRLGFFRSLLDFRWQRQIASPDDSDLFIDLEPECKTILGFEPVSSSRDAVPTSEQLGF